MKKPLKFFSFCLGILVFNYAAVSLLQSQINLFDWSKWGLVYWIFASTVEILQRFYSRQNEISLFDTRTDQLEQRNQIAELQQHIIRIDKILLKKRDAF